MSLITKNSFEKESLDGLAGEFLANTLFSKASPYPLISLKNTDNKTVSKQAEDIVHAVICQLVANIQDGDSCFKINREQYQALHTLAQEHPWLVEEQNEHFIEHQVNAVFFNKEHIWLKKYRDSEFDIEVNLRAHADFHNAFGLDKESTQKQLDNKLLQLAQLPNANERIALDDFGAKAVHTCLDSHLAVITGGPGTGKTTIVVLVLAVLIEQYLSDNPNEKPIIEVLAPTGKASARVKESILSRKRLWQSQEFGVFSKDVVELIPEHTSTIHKYLGIHAITGQPKFHADKKINADIVVVDEASMVDVVTFAKLTNALSPSTRLIFLGDPYQLASVEAGNVLANIVNTSKEQNIHWLKKCCVELQKSRRFAGDIQRFAESIIASDGCAKKAIGILHQDNLENIEMVNKGSSSGESSDKTPHSKTMEKALDGYKPYKKLINSLEGNLTDDILDEIFNTFECWQVFTPYREGNFGVSGLNQYIEDNLWADESNSKPPSSNKFRYGKNKPADFKWYIGKPIIVTSNDPTLGLFNGDIGIYLDDDKKLVYFPQLDDTNQEEARNSNRENKTISLSGYRAISKSCLPQHQTVYAMTVHKSQGSEYEECLLVVPEPTTDEQKKLLSREILYTAITRAKSKVYISARDEEIETMIVSPTQRESGLFKKDDCSLFASNNICTYR